MSTENSSFVKLYSNGSVLRDNPKFLVNNLAEVVRNCWLTLSESVAVWVVIAIRIAVAQQQNL
jgi:hypothetical protein